MLKLGLFHLFHKESNNINFFCVVRCHRIKEPVRDPYLKQEWTSRCIIIVCNCSEGGTLWAVSDGETQLQVNQLLTLVRTTSRVWSSYTMMTSSNGNIFRVTGFLREEFTGHLWCLLWSAAEPTVPQTIETPVFSNTIALIITSL